MLNSTERVISTAHKTKMLKSLDFSCFKTIKCCIHPANKFLNANNSVVGI